MELHHSALITDQTGQTDQQEQPQIPTLTKMQDTSRHPH